MDADRLDLGPVRVALLRRPSASGPQGEAYLGARVEVLDLPLPVGDQETLSRLGLALASSCQAFVLDLEEDELAGQLASDTQLPVVLASQAALIRNTAQVLVGVAALEEPLEELRFATGGSAARSVGEILHELGVPEESIQPLQSGSEPLPPRTDVLLVPDEDRGKLAGSDKVQAEIGLFREDGGLVLPALARAAADADVRLDPAACAVVARALAGLARGGQLPLAGDPRLVPVLAGAAAAAVGADPGSYREALEELGSPLRRAVRDALPPANKNLRRLVFVDGEDPAVILAARRLADEGFAVPVLLGDLFRLESRAREQGLTLKGIRVLNPQRDKWRAPYAKALHEILGRELGLDLEAAERRVDDPLIFGALTVAQGEAHGLVALTDRGDPAPLEDALRILQRRQTARSLSGAHIVATADRTLVVTDTAVAADPTSEELAQAALHGAALARCLLGVAPRVALVAHSSYGSSRDRQLARIARACDLVAVKAPDLEIDGPLEADAALSGELQGEAYTFCALNGPANVLVVPGRTAAQVVVKTLQQVAGAEVVGPFLWGLRQPAIVAPHTASAVELELVARLGAAQALDAEAAEAPPPSALTVALKEAIAEAIRLAPKLEVPETSEIDPDSEDGAPAFEASEPELVALPESDPAASSETEIPAFESSEPELVALPETAEEEEEEPTAEEEEEPTAEEEEPTAEEEEEPTAEEEEPDDPPLIDLGGGVPSAEDFLGSDARRAARRRIEFGTSGDD